MPQNYTTADDYLPDGWYPGKKHTLGQNIKRVASIGIYNPDDRKQSGYNKQIVANKVSAAAARERAGDVLALEEKRRAAAEQRLMENLQRMYPDMAPDAMSKLVGSALGGQKVVTDVANDRAGEQDAIRRELRAVGGQVGASQTGAEMSAAEAAMARAEKEKAAEDKAAAEARMRKGVPDATANSTAASQDYNRLKTLFDKDKLGVEQDIFNTTAERALETGVQEAENKFAEENLRGAAMGNEARITEGTSEVLGKPGMAAEIGGARMTKPLSTQVGAGSVLFTPGMDPRKGMETSITVVDTGIDDMGNVTRRTPVKTVGAGNQIPSTAEPAPAVAPNGRMIKVNGKWVPKGN